MQEFDCILKTADGKTIKKNKVKAEDEITLMAQIKASGLYLVKYEKSEQKQHLFRSGAIKLSTKDIAIFTRQLSAMLESGITLIRALNILYLQIEQKNIKASIKLLYENVQRGDQLSEAMRKQNNAYPEIMINMIEAGEASGRLDGVIAKVADTFENEVKLNDKVKTAMTYPIILTLVSIAVIMVLVTNVLPVFLDMFTEDMTLPLPTRIIILFSDILTNYWYLVLILIFLIAIAIKIYLGTEEGLKQWHATLLKMPIVGSTATKIASVRFCRTLNTLLSSGMTLIQSLGIVTQVVGNRVIMEGLNNAQEDLRKGVTFSQALRKADVLPPMVYSMIGIGEESGALEEMLEKTAEYFDNEVENAIQKMVTLLEPILIVFMGGIIGFIIISVMLPMMQIYQNIG